MWTVHLLRILSIPNFFIPRVTSNIPTTAWPQKTTFWGFENVQKHVGLLLSEITKKKQKQKNKTRNDRGTGVHKEQFLYCCCGQLSRLEGVANSFETPSFITCQAPLSMGCPRQGSWSGLPFPSPGDLPDPVIEPAFPALAALGSLPLSQQGSPS